MAYIDSDILIGFLRKDKDSTSKINALRENDDELSITSINSFEVLKGVTSFSKVSKATISAFLSNFRIHDFNYVSSEKAAEIFNNLKEEGNLIELPDIMIASIAISNNEPLLTNNKRHFQRIKELKLL